MKLPAPIAFRAGAGPSCTPRAVLGRDHPLVRAIEARETAARQALTVAGVLAGSLIALAESAHWAGALALSAGVVLLVLVFVIAALEEDKRDRARALIRDGHESLPLPAVQHERRRLLARRTRSALAHTLERVCVEAERCPGVRPRLPLPLFDVRAVAAAASELRRAARLLADDRVPARAVALIDWLVTDCSSPLYGDSVARLHAALERINEQTGD